MPHIRFMGNEAFYQRLRRIRQTRGLTMKAVSEEIGVPVSTYREWEYGRAIQGMPYPRLAEVLKVSLFELMTGQVPVKSELLNTLHLIEELSKKAQIQLESFF